MSFEAPLLSVIALSSNAVFATSVKYMQHVGEDMRNFDRDGRAMQPFMHNGVTEAQLLYSSKCCTTLISACQLHVSNLQLICC